MMIAKCPACKTLHILIYTPTITTPGFPFISCKKCGNNYIPRKFIKRIRKDYTPPKKWQIPLCGLPVGLIGLALIIIGMYCNKPIIVLFGGIIFSFWILIIAMAIFLWKEILRKSKDEYKKIKEECSISDI